MNDALTSVWRVISHYIIPSLCFILLLNSPLLHAQDHLDEETFCGTRSDYPNFTKSLSSNTTDCIMGYDDFNNMLTIRTHVYIIRKDDGTGGRTQAEAYQAINNLKNVFNPYGIDFNVTVMDDILDNLSYNYTSVTNCSLWGSSHCPYNIHPTHCAALNIFILDDNEGLWDGGKADGIPSLSVAIGGIFNGEDVLLSTIFAHEVGHALGLFHTHNGTTCNINNIYEPICAELVNGSNCCDCGDFICDTEAEPILTNTASDCSFNPKCDIFEDSNGDSYLEQTGNIMSYSPSFCLSDFTTGQVQRMRYHIKNHPVLQPAAGLGQDSPPTINTGENIWKEAYVIQGQDLIVPTGSTLILDGASLYFSDDAGIVVEQGARLIIKGHSLLDHCCQGVYSSSIPKYWKGIRALGDPTIPHPNNISSNTSVLYPNHGLVEISEYSNIEHAQVGVRSYEYNAGLAGWAGAGIVRSNQAEFRNCHTSILLGRINNNQHILNETVFWNRRAAQYPTQISSFGETNSIGIETRQIQLRYISNVQIESCYFNKFPNYDWYKGLFFKTSFPYEIDHVYGIYADHSDVLVSNSEFVMHTQAIDIYDNYGKSVIIEDCYFGTYRGISLNSTFGAIIDNNNFEAIINNNNFTPFGITCYDSFGFNISNNIFGADVDEGAINNTYGLVMHNSEVLSNDLSGFPNIIQENTFQTSTYLNAGTEPFRAATAIIGHHADLDFQCNYYNEEHFADWLLADNIDDTGNFANDFHIEDLSDCDDFNPEPVVQQWHIPAAGAGNPANNRFHIENLSMNALEDLVWQQVEPKYLSGDVSVAMTECNPNNPIQCNEELDPVLQPGPCNDNEINWTRREMASEIYRLQKNREKDTLRFVLDCIGQPWSNLVLSADYLNVRDGEQALWYADQLPDFTPKEQQIKTYYVTQAQALLGTGKKEVVKEMVQDLLEEPVNLPIHTLAETYIAAKTGNTFMRNVLLPTDKNKDQNNTKIATLQCAPNPTDQYTNLLLEDKWLNQNQLTCKIIDSYGRIVDSQILEKGQAKLNTSDLQNGVYLLTLCNDQNNIIASGRLVVIH